MDADVIVAGYGPCGQTAAALLASRGHRVIVVERWPTRYGLPRVATIDGESARIIQAAADVDAALSRSLGRDTYLLANEAGQVLVRQAWDGPSIHGFPNRISLHQPDTEDALDAAARARGTVIWRGWEAVGIEQDAGSVTLIARQRFHSDGSSATGAEKRLTARYLIGADGARSAVRESLGIPREAWPFRGAWLSYDATRKRPLPDFRGTSPDGQIAVIFCVPQGRSHSMIPLGTDYVRFNFQRPPDSDQSHELNRDSGYRHIRDVFGLTADDIDIVRHAFYTFEGRLATRWRDGRALIAGDAAHAMTPFLGQGGCAAFRDAIQLAWKLDLVLRELAPESLLDTYELERKPHVRQHVEGSDRLAALAFMDDPLQAAERDARLLGNRAPPKTADPIVEAGVLDSNDAPRAPVGALGPQGRLRASDNREGRGDDLLGWGFQLIGWQHDPRALLTEHQHEWLAAIHAGALRVDAASDLDGAYQAFRDAHRIEGWLLRPDFTVFGIVHTPDEWPALVDRLRLRLSG